MTSDERLRIHQNQPLPSYMARLAARRLSGVLSARADDACREIVFVDGEIRAARSDLEGEMLGRWLVERDQITEDDRALTLLSQGRGDSPPLGHLLVTRGSLDAATLEKELQELALTIIRRAAAAPRTYAEFHKAADREHADTLPNLTTPCIILEAARSFGDVEAMRSEIGDTGQTARPASDLQTLLVEVGLTPTEAFFLSRLDGTRSIAGLLKISSLPEEQAIATLYALVAAGLVEIGPARHPQPAAASRPAPAAPPVSDEAFDSAAREERESIRRMAEQLSRIDHYRALGLRPGAPGPDIDEAWRAAQERYGPARSERPHLADLREQVAAILERARDAHEVLSDPRSRSRYDTVLESLRREHHGTEASRRTRSETDPGVRSAIVEANIKRAAELVQDGELYLAVQLLEQACALEPRPPAMLDLARLLLRNPLWTNRALDCIRRAIEIDPKYVDAWIELAEFWRRRNNAERQRKALERALAVDPASERANQMYRLVAGRRALDKLVKRARQSR